MKAPDIPLNEEARLAALHSCFILDTPAEPTFDALTSLAQKLLRVPIALLSLVDSRRQWFKSRQGLDATETSREISFCGHAVASGEPLVIHDATADDRFADNPLVTGDLHIRFYAGIPLVTHDGLALGTLCVIDYVARLLSPEQQDILTTLAAQAIAHLEKRRETAWLSERLRAAQRAQQAFFEIALDLLCIADLQLVPQHLNAAWGHIVGWSAAELSSHPLTRWQHPDDAAASQTAIAQLQQGAAAVNFRSRFRHRDGGWIPLSWSVTTHQGMFYAVAHDLTTLESERASLLRSEARLRAIFDAVAEGIIITDESGVLQQVNPAIKRLTGYSAAELVGQHFLKLAPPAYVDAASALRDHHVRGGSEDLFSAHREGSIVTKQGITCPVQVSRSEFQTGGARKFLAVVRDISDQKRHQAELIAAKQAAEDASSAKSQFLANMSHEIRTPLNAVLGYATLLLDAPLPGVQHQHVQAICTAANSLLGQLNAILDLSKIEANRLELEIGPTELRLAMEDAVEIVAEQARRKNLALTCIVDPDCPMHILCDSGRLRQVLINLAHNAVKFTERGEVILRARRVSSEADAQVQFTVRDTGPGMRSETLAKLFQPFSQADASIARRHGGTGLGLSICRRLVEAMGGSIGVDSQLGAGSTFWFALPLKIAPPPSDDTPALPARLRGCSALIVDAQVTHREQLASILGRLGLQAVPCGSAAAALAISTADLPAPPGVVLVASTVPDAKSEALAEELASKLRPLAPANQLLMIETLPLGPAVDAGRPLKPIFAAQLTAPIRAHRVARMLHDLCQPPVTLDPRGATNLRLPQAHLPAPRILVAEDNPANQRLAKLILQRMGCRVDVVADGQEAVATVSLFSFDAILMDLQMPEMTGIEATQAIRRLPPPACHVPIVALTASAYATDRKRMISEGMNDYLSKPLNIDELQRVLQRLLPRHFPNRATQVLSDSLPPPHRLDAARELQQDLESIRERLHELSNLLDAASAEEVVALVRADWPRTLRAAQACQEASDLRGVGQQAHYLAGSALQVGASGLAKQCRALEEASQRQDSAQAQKFLAAVAERVGALLTGL
jgi:two-component system sensor histidine kinase/response regulator